MQIPFFKGRLVCGSLKRMVPYSGFLLRLKTFANCLKIDFRGENFCGFTVSQFTTPINTASEGQHRVLSLYGSAVLDRSRAGAAGTAGKVLVTLRLAHPDNKKWRWKNFIHTVGFWHAGFWLATKVLFTLRTAWDLAPHIATLQASKASHVCPSIFKVEKTVSVVDISVPHLNSH